MDVLFQMTLSGNNRQETYDVSFKNDTYLFTPSGSSDGAFRLRREHDEWRWEGNVTADAAAHAMKVLDEYLLSQH